MRHDDSIVQKFFNMSVASDRARLPLRGPIAAVFDETAEILRRFAYQESLRLRLGGGTVLAARWGHRHSTDLDFHMSRNDMRWVLSSPARIANLNRAFRKIHAPLSPETPYSGVAPQSGTVMADRGGTPVSMFLMSAETHDADGAPQSLEHVGTESRILAASTDVILRGKMDRLRSMRSSGHRWVTARDLYDLVAVTQFEPGALQTILNDLKPYQRSNILNNMRQTPPDFWHTDPRPVTQESMPVDAGSILGCAIRAFEQADESALEDAIVGRSHDGDDGGHAP